ncbi:hypothetical protein BDQ94DRAFT_159461 [Aspergillus welwitschiae]|uniref:Uncharacterized protein n=1 Tax=Aspergillus welwitschiae TaxID=1341132 RepID=A0A3F3Q3C1_9EURO|nr:hypothetical protein BDQ94DRAFT_159461 [Aspergillus welwitschiae]RDH33176.1 hypothetical protein BDQ94DRAFT_159461 [Aspergillus welwitschiae]
MPGHKPKAAFSARRDGRIPRATNFVHKAICGLCFGMHDPQRFQVPESQISGSARLSDVNTEQDRTVTPDPISVSV